MGLKVCIIGCGDMGRTHAAGWKLREDDRIVAVADPMDDRRAKMVDDTGATGYADWKEAVLHEGVDVVSVCVPVCFHSEVACFAMRNGRHVLCEKPLALTMEQADEMVQTAKETGMLLSTSFQYRGFARIPKVRQLLQDGAFGGPLIVRFTDIREVRPKLAMHRRSMNGGPVIDMSGHFFDLIRYITGEEPVSVYAKGHVFGKGKPRLAEVEDFAIDAADIQVEMTGGHVLNVLVNWGMPEGFGSLTEELFIGPELSVRCAGGQIEMRSRAGTETWDAKDGNPPGSTIRINGLADAIIQGTQPEVTGEDGRIALKLSLAALESIETGSVIQV
jgi:UDP-N-acetylglucosamine 3-dehydrogenase